jgi:acyl carrier protein
MVTNALNEPGAGDLVDLVDIIIEEIASLKQHSRVSQDGIDTAQLSANSLLWSVAPEDRDGLPVVGLDSVDMLSLLIQLEERMGIETPAEVDAWTCPTIGDLARLLSLQPRL